MCDVKKLRKWIADGNRIVLFGAGQNGYTFYKILKLLEISIECVVDNNEQKWGRKVYEDEVVCCSPIILSGREEYLTYICISPQYYSEIYEQAIQLNVLHIGNIYNVIKDVIKNYKDLYFQLLLELPYGKCWEFFYDNKNYLSVGETLYRNHHNDRIAVYTSVFGTYDNLFEPQSFADNIDYYFVSEEKPFELKKYMWLDAKSFLPKEIENPIEKNRYIKMHPHILFPQYQYSIYVDGNVEVLQDLSAFIQKSKTGISVFRHPYRDDIYLEALAVVNASRAKAKAVKIQMEKYICEGFPEAYGLVEMRIIAREHNNPVCISVMEAWWEEFRATDTKRDQLSFMYTMWKQGMGLEDLFLLGNNMRKFEYIKVHDHAK